MIKHNWKQEFPSILELGRSGKTMQEIADVYGCTREWIRQLYRRNGVDPRSVGIPLRSKLSREEKARLHFLKWGDTAQDLYDVKRAKWRGKKGNAAARGIPFTLTFSEISWPTHCPVLGMELDYMTEGRQENSVSFDRIDDTQGYLDGNVVICSWRANRLKNNGTADEHQKIADFYKKFLQSETKYDKMGVH